MDLFTGVIISANAGTAAITVVREGWTSDTVGALNQMQGILVSSVMANYLGFNQSTLPQPGTRVICLQNTVNSCYILGMIPDQGVGIKSVPARAMLGAKDALADGAHRLGHEKYTTRLFPKGQQSDVVDGDHVVSNEFGVLLGLYQQLANLKASELSQIQCFLLDDLVRIISHNFQHYTALGEFNIWHDGTRLLAEFGATHRTPEIYGQPCVNEDSSQPVFEEVSKHTPDDKQDFYTIKDDERVKAIERFKLFLGSVGDFIHIFLVRPHEREKRSLDPSKEPKEPDLGLADIHLGTDGGVHLRSVKEVFIEKSNWIRVPLRKAVPEDPEGDDAESLKYDRKEKFEFNNDYKYKDNPFTYALQIRDYVAYVNEKLGYQNFKSQKKDFYVNDDYSKETKLDEINFVDVDTPVDLKEYALRTAGIYLMPNGGITIRDAWNSAIVMEGGNIYLQPAKDLVSQPLRNNIVKAGGHINMACRKDIDLSSSEEGVRVKSEKAQYFYSDNSGIILQAKGEKDVPGLPAPESADALEYVGGIVLKSNLGIYNYAQKDFVAYAKKKVLLQSLENTDILGGTTLTTYGKQMVNTFSDGPIFSVAEADNYVLASSSVMAAGAGNTLLGQKDQKLGVMYDKKSIFIDVLYGMLDVPKTTDTFNKLKEAKQEVLKQTTFGNEDRLDGLKFKFLSSKKYGNLDPKIDGLPATLAQQDDLLTELYSLETWEEKEINSTRPYPGSGLFDNFLYSAEKPSNVEKSGSSSEYVNKANSETTPSQITLDSLTKYKVQKLD